MITIKCIETKDVYVLSGDDENFRMKVYNELAASLAGLMKNDVYLKMHQKDLEYRIAIAKLTGFNHAFHAHERAYTLKKNTGPKLFIASAPTLIGKSYYQEFARRRNEERFQNPINFSDVP